MALVTQWEMFPIVPSEYPNLLLFTFLAGGGIRYQLQLPPLGRDLNLKRLVTASMAFVMHS